MEERRREIPALVLILTLLAALGTYVAVSAFVQADLGAAFWASGVISGVLWMLVGLIVLAEVIRR